MKFVSICNAAGIVLLLTSCTAMAAQAYTPGGGVAPSQGPPLMPDRGYLDANNSNLMLQQFVSDISKDNRVELESSQMALHNSTNPGIRKMAQQIITDNQQYSDQISAAAQAVIVPLTYKFSSKYLKNQNKMALLKGNAFDKAILKQMDSLFKDDISAADTIVSAQTIPLIYPLKKEANTRADYYRHQIGDLSKAAKQAGK